MIAPPVFWGHTYDWFLIMYYVGISAFIACMFFYIRIHPVFKVSLSFIGYGAIFYGIHSLTRPFWILLDNHFNGSFTLYDHSFTEAWHHVDSSDRWYFCVLFLVIFLCVLACKKDKESTNLLYGADIILISICLTMPIARIGCFLSGHGCYGIPTDMPWGCTFCYGLPSHVPVHPIPLYDMALNICVFIFLNIKRWYLRYPGRSALTVLTAASIHNIITGPLRGMPPIVFAGITMTQILYSIVLIFCVILYLRLQRRENLIKPA